MHPRFPITILTTLVASFGVLSSVLAAKRVVPSADHPTIQSAVDAAQPGDVIVVKKGVYPEFVLVAGKTDLRIVGKKKAIIRLPVPLAAAPALWVNNSSAIEVRNLRVEDSPEAGILVKDSTDVTITKCDVRRTPTAGIRVEGGSGVSLVGNRVRDAISAISLATDSSAHLVEDNDLRDSNFGMQVDGHHHTIQGNRVQSIALIGVLGGGFLQDASDLLIAENVVVGDSGGPATGNVFIDNVFPNFGP